jgi:hypothetical protein
MIRSELNRIMYNIHQKEYNSPFGNTGERFECETFKVHAFDWADDNQPWNFVWKDVQISWYKYLGRGMKINCEFSPDDCAEMLRVCLTALEQYEKDNDKDRE